jgi:PAS domain-containing protein
MEEQSKLAERILDQVADAVICTDRSGTIIRWNHASAALFGYSSEEALGQSVELIIPEHLRAAHWAGFDAAMAKGITKLEGRPTLTRWPECARQQTGCPLSPRDTSVGSAKRTHVYSLIDPHEDKALSLSCTVHLRMRIGTGPAA